MKMLREISADFKAMNQTPSDMRKFGFLLGLILLVLGSVIFYRQSQNVDGRTILPALLLFFGIVCIAIAGLKPMLIKPINTVMLVVSLIIGWLMTQVVLVVLFFGLFFPVGIGLKLFGKDPMNRKFEPAANSYWKIRPDEPFEPSRCRRLF